MYPHQCTSITKLYLTLPHFRACSKPDLDFHYYIWWSFCAQSFKMRGGCSFRFILFMKKKVQKVMTNIPPLSTNTSHLKQIVQHKK